jgi:hypothetical protein
MEWYYITLLVLLYVWTVTIIMKTALDIAKIMAIRNTEERVEFAQQMSALGRRLQQYNEPVQYPPQYQ